MEEGQVLKQVVYRSRAEGCQIDNSSKKLEIITTTYLAQWEGSFGAWPELVAEAIRDEEEEAQGEKASRKT